MYVFLNGKFMVAGAAKVSVFDHGFLYGDGVYETMRTFGGKLWRPERHMNRFFRSLEMMGIPAIWNDDEILDWIEEGIEKNGFKETRIRVTATRGENGFEVLEVKKPTLLISFGDLKNHEEEYETGVRVVSCHAERALPEAKTISMAPVMRARLEKENEDAFEVLLLDNAGFVKEGSVTNVFVVKAGNVFTPGEGVLEGTTAGLVRSWIGVEDAQLVLDDFYTADEVFLTNALVGVMPVVDVDGYLIGTGKPGMVARSLIDKFQLCGMD